MQKRALAIFNSPAEDDNLYSQNRVEITWDDLPLYILTYRYQKAKAQSCQALAINRISRMVPVFLGEECSEYKNLYKLAVWLQNTSKKLETNQQTFSRF